MKLAINLVLSAAMLALCAYLVWPNEDTRKAVAAAIEHLSLVDLLPYVALLIVMQLCRSLRWNNLLAPMGVRVPTGPLLAISAVGFMAILALPARLGEFVRPGLLRKRGGVSAAAALGTIAVERIVDGLLISLFVFGALFAHRDASSPDWMMPMAYAALGVFSAALVFLLFALRWPKATCSFCVKLTLLPRFAPRVGTLIEHKLLDMVSGFVVLRDRKNMIIFIAWSVAYWGANGLGLWVLANAFDAGQIAHGLPTTMNLPVIGAFAAMGVVGVGIMLPNSPGLVGQFQYFMMLGAGLYLGFDPRTDHVSKLYELVYAFCTLHYLLQVIWYVFCGALGLLSPWVSFHDLWSARKVAPDAVAGEPVA
jgi:hypothetical protein